MNHEYSHNFLRIGWNTTWLCRMSYVNVQCDLMKRQKWCQVQTNWHETQGTSRHNYITTSHFVWVLSFFFTTSHLLANRLRMVVPCTPNAQAEAAATIGLWDRVVVVVVVGVGVSSFYSVFLPRCAKQQPRPVNNNYPSLYQYRIEVVCRRGSSQKKIEKTVKQMLSCKIL